MTAGAVRRFEVEHRTAYQYGAPMTDGYTVACLVPRPTDWQQVVESVVRLEPPPSEHDSYLDAFGNLVHEFGVHELHGALTITARSVVDVAAPAAAGRTTRRGRTWWRSSTRRAGTWR